MKRFLFLLLIVASIALCNDYDDANTFFENGKFDQAIIKIDSFLKQYPDNIEGYILKGQILIGQQKFDDAKEVLTTANAIDQSNPLVYAYLALVLWTSGDGVSAVSQIGKALSMAPDDPDIQLIYGAMQLEIGDVEEALEAFDKVVKAKPDSPDGLLSRSVAKNMSKDYDGAIEDASKVITLQPDNIEARFQRNRYYVNKSEYEKAIMDINHIIKIDPDNSDAFLTRARLKLRMGDMNGSISDHEKAIELNPGSVDAYISLGAIYQQSGQNQKAIDKYSELIKISPTYPEGRFYRASAYFRDKQYENANDDIRIALYNAPDDPTYWGFAAMIALYMGYQDEALRDFYRAVWLDDKEKERISNGKQIKMWLEENPDDAEHFRTELNKIISPYKI